MYSNVKALLQNEKHPELYSMDMETDNIEYLSIENPIERFYVYKSGNVNMKSVYTGAIRYRKIKAQICKSIVDCDSCDLIKDVYSLLWQQAIADNENSLINGQRGDTMTSLQHSLNFAFSLIETEENRRKYFKGKNISLAYQIEVLFYDKNFLSRMKNIEGFETFATMYHTIGNFIPVPLSFNSSRSYFGVDDYWDVTLSYIKKWYDTKDDTVITSLLHKKNPKNEAVTNCLKWLNWFGKWEKFIDENYLQDFVNPKTKEPILFKPHSAKETTTFFKTCSALIKRRGKRMVDELKKRV